MRRSCVSWRRHRGLRRRRERRLARFDRSRKDRKTSPAAPARGAGHMLLGCVHVSKTDGAQSLDLQRDALREAGVVDAVNLYHDFASGLRDATTGRDLDSCLRALTERVPTRFVRKYTARAQRKPPRVLPSRPPDAGDRRRCDGRGVGRRCLGA